MRKQISKPEEEWRRELTPKQYHILREKGTEPAFTGEYEHARTPGVYRCAACGQELFSSDAKYDSGSGWPSFFRPVATENIREEADRGYGMVRTEILCRRCGAHLGHVFDDGPPPTGLRYCLNSEALRFVEAGQLKSLAEAAP